MADGRWQSVWGNIEHPTSNAQHPGWRLDDGRQIADEDWELYVRALRPADQLALAELQEYAGAEAADVRNTNGDKLFWRKTYEQIGKVQASRKEKHPADT